MATIAAMDYIEIVQTEFGTEPLIAGTQIGVDEVVIMHVRHGEPVDWIVENFEVLNHAKVYAALAYYYDHQDQINAIIDRPEDFSDGMTLADLKAKIATRQGITVDELEAKLKAHQHQQK
jgi:uncharacterized protein (DUF433 family)